jgi:mandelamide amidase
MVAQRGQVQAATARFFADNGLSAMVFPAISALPAPVGEESDAQIQGRKVSFFKAYGRNTALGPVASLASLVIPVGLSTGGLPIALEVSKLPGQDLELLQLGGALEPVIGALAKPRLAPSGAAAA